MYDIIFYDDEHGNEPVREYIDKLQRKAKKSKDARINLNKIIA